MESSGETKKRDRVEAITFYSVREQMKNKMPREIY